MRQFTLPLFLLPALITSSTVCAQEWPQWRGPDRTGVVPAASAPASWPSKFDRAWRAELGEGYSSPVVSGGKVFVHHRKDPEEIVTAIDLASGKPVWEVKYASAFAKNPYADKMHKGPYATPLSMNGALFTVGGSSVVHALNASTGAVMWKRDFSSLVDTSKMFCGNSSSPLAVGDDVLVQVGSDTKGGQIHLLDAKTGATKWQWSGPGPGYTAPMLFTLGQSQQVVTMTQQSIVGISAKDGKELWSIPFPDEFQENIVTPAWTGTHLIVSGVRLGTHAYSLVATGGKWMAVKAWSNTAVTMYMSSPIAADGVIYGHSNKKRGHFVALDAKTGTVKWASEGRDGDNAQLLLTSNSLLYLTDGGELVVAKRDPAALSGVKRIKVADAATHGVPALLPDGLIVRDAGGVTRWRVPR